MSDDVENPLEDLPRLIVRHIFRPKYLDHIAWLESRVQADRALLDEATRRSAPAEIIDLLQSSMATTEQWREQARADLDAFDTKYGQTDPQP